ncbi:MAG: trypsin-like peptidase domain-containing protein [Pyrinomonadaceae bacterium]
MAVGIIIHISVGSERRTEFFSENRLSIGSDESCDLQIHSKKIEAQSAWITLENTDGVYRLIDFDPTLNLLMNDKPVRRYIAVSDGDVLQVGESDITLGFFSIEQKPSLISTKRSEMTVAPFISEAALDAAASPKRDDAKAFLREFVRELSREISWTTKAIILVLSVGFVTGILYLGFAMSSEMRANRKQAEEQQNVIARLEDQLGNTSSQLGELDKTNKELLRSQSLAQNVRVDYGTGICLIVGLYDLVDRSSGKVLRYQDAAQYGPLPVEPAPQEDGSSAGVPIQGLTTTGNGSTVEYDFIGTGFHVGGGYIITNKHVLQPWTEDDLVKQMMRTSNGRARVKKMVIYFPGVPQPFPLKIRDTSSTEDVAVASIDPDSLPEGIPSLPLEPDSQAATIGKTVVTMGYPSGPDRLLAMVDDEEAKSINARFGNSRTNLINFLAQSMKIVPLTTQGAITDLDSRRIVHDAKTAVGGSGAPLFGQSGKVIGVNFGVFTENTASNLAVPIRFAVEILRRSGWKTPEEIQAEVKQGDTATSNTNSAPGVSALKP